MRLLSIKINDKYEEVVKNSKFISLIFRVYNKTEVNDYLNKVKKDYSGATHYCYGYVIDDDIKFSDDNEPSRTAGLPIISQIEGHKLNYTLIIVVRYFGGIKLGTGLLTRTYLKMAREVIRQDNIVNLVKGYEVTITFDYSDLKRIDYLLKNRKIIKKDFDSSIVYTVIVLEDDLTKLSNYEVKINKEIYIEKE